MAKVLLFNIEDGKGIRIKNLCRKLYFESEDVPKERFGCKLGDLLEHSADVSSSDGEDFDEEMLYLADIDGGMLNIFLAQLRRVKAPVALKAVGTETNRQFTVCELYREISAERDAIASGQIAHPSE